jgi:hypothetical protein
MGSAVSAVPNLAAYASFVPHSEQNFAPGETAPQLGQVPGGAFGTTFVPHSGQNFAPFVGEPQLVQVSVAGWTIAVPHSGQNFVPGAAKVSSIGQRAISLLAALATSLTCLMTPDNPNALAKPFNAAPACSPEASAISSERGLSSLQ